MISGSKTLVLSTPLHHLYLTSHQIIPSGPSETISTPSSLIIGVFARECQISHLVGRVIRHVFDPTLDVTFQEEEAILLERTLLAFLPLLLEEGIVFGKYCVALGICSRLVVSYHFHFRCTGLVLQVVCVG